jgi:hypothetical protein
MDRQHLIDLIASLSSEEQAAVEEFAKFLKEGPPRNGQKIDFREALESFTRKHEDLLRRLAR